MSQTCASLCTPSPPPCIPSPLLPSYSYSITAYVTPDRYYPEIYTQLQQAKRVQQDVAKLFDLLDSKATTDAERHLYAEAYSRNPPLAHQLEQHCGTDKEEAAE